MQMRTGHLPDSYEPLIRAALMKRGYSLDEPGQLAQAVLKLSDFYLNNPSVQTPWDEIWAQVASLVYFFPLNYSRCQLVIREAARLGFFDGLTSVVDEGAGMGSAIHALRDHVASGRQPSWQARDISIDALMLLNELSLGPSRIQTHHVNGTLRARGHTRANSLLTASYVFTELKSLPAEWLEYEALIILEPSTRDDARRLQAERKTLLAAGFELWAPCPHADDCPLLQSEKDWCHDRVHFEAPGWFGAIEKSLPIKNRTLSFSYLVARKAPAPVRSRNSTAERKLARLVGDTLDEKGKSRQSVCRSNEREFLAWFPQRFKTKIHLEMSRGSLVELAPALEKKSQEVRLKEPGDVVEFATDASVTT